MMSAGGTWSARSPPDLRSSHGAPDLLHLGEHVFAAARFLRPPPIVGDTRCRQAPGVAHIGIEVDRLVCIGEIFRLRDHWGVPREGFREEVAIARTPGRNTGW